MRGDAAHDAVDVLCDLLLAEDLRVNQVTPGPVDRRHPPVPAAIPVAHGRHGLDVRRRQAVARAPTARFPRILGQFVRDEALLTLEDGGRAR